MYNLLSRSLVILGGLLAAPMSANAAPIVFSGTGTNAAGIQGVVDSYRAALGSNRREIDWDGGGLQTTTNTGTPFNGFLNSEGVQFATPGLGFMQATPDGLASINPTYAGFDTFSSFRLFTPVDSNVTDVLFYTPGSNGVDATTISGFGAIFSDVDLAETTTLQYFDRNGNQLGTFFASEFVDGLSFLGVLFNGGELVSRVRITTGNSVLGQSDGSGADVVVMDNFIYAIPQAVRTVPEPATWLLLSIGLAGFYWRKQKA